MSLDYDVSGIVNKAENFPPDDAGLMHDDLHVIIWTCYATGIGNLTEDSIPEFIVRAALVNSISPLFNINVSGVRETYLVSEEQVWNACGLTTNVGMESRAEFWKGLKRRMDSRMRQVRENHGVNLLAEVDKQKG